MLYIWRYVCLVTDLTMELTCKLQLLSELGKLLYESNVLHITSYFYKEVIYVIITVTYGTARV